MSHVSTTIASGSGSASIVINKPAVVVGDIVRVSVYFSANSTMSAADAAFTLRDSLTVSGSVLGRFYTYWRRIDGTEGSTWTFTQSTTFSWRAIVQVIRGRIRTGDPYQADADDSSTNGTNTLTATAAVGLSGVLDNCDLVCDYTRHSTSTATSWTPPSGMTEQGDAALVGTATQEGVAAGNYTGKSALAVGGGVAYPKIWLGALKPEPAPGVPTSVMGTAVDDDALSLSWAAPASGVVDHYEVRIDGGGWVTATSPHVFTGLSPDTEYDLEVRAVGPALPSAAVLVAVTTLSAPVPTPEGYYRVELSAGPYSWDVVRGDTPAYGVMLPLSLGWDMPDGEEFYPQTPNMPTMVFQLLAQDAQDLSDLVEGSTVSFRMYLDADPEAEPWQSFDGIVTQLVGEAVTGTEDPDTLDFQVTVYASDDVMRLASMVIGYAGDWPLEAQGERLDRIGVEAGFDVDTLFGSGLEGWLAARSARPTTALAAVRDTLKDTAWTDESSLGGPYFGCYALNYTPAHLDELGDPVAAELLLTPIPRRVYDDQSNVVTIDGANVFAPSARWAKLRGTTAATWGLVDTTVFGTPDSSTPFWRSTSLLDYFGDPPGSEVNGSAAMRDRIGDSLLATSSTQLDGWHARVLRLDTTTDPESASPAAVSSDVGMASACPAVAISVIVTPLKPELQLEAEDYLAGTLVGARLTLPPNGNHYVELSLRAEVLDGVVLP